MTQPPLNGRIIRDVRVERFAQLEKWGDQHHPDGTDPGQFTEAAQTAQAANAQYAESGLLSWSHIMLEEVYEALASAPDSPELRDEIVQIMAVCSAWLEDFDSRRPSNGRPVIEP